MSLGPEYYERQYNNRLAIPDANVWNERGVTRSAAARSRLRSHLDIAYGPSPRQRIDIYPAAPPDAPILSFIHGGYWRSRDKSEFAFIAEPFVAAGITVAMPEYDLAPAVSVETIVKQMLAAHAWLYRHGREYGANPNRMFVAGHSAGGHLAAMMAAASWNQYRPDESGARAAHAPLPANLIKGACTISGVFDLAPIIHFSFNEAIGLDAASARAMSPITYLPELPVPVYTVVGALESDEFKRQCKVLAEHWPHCVRSHMEVPGCHHLSVPEALADTGNALFRSVRDRVLNL
jgi:arylformamidase